MPAANTVLVHPMQWRRRSGAVTCCSLYNGIGARVTEWRGRWCVIVETHKPDAVHRWLERTSPGVEWQEVSTEEFYR